MEIKKYEKGLFDPKPGEVYSGVPNHVYHSLSDFISSSDIKNALRSYDIFKQSRLETKHTLPMEIGSAVHWLMEHKDLTAISPTDSLGVKWENEKEKNPDIPLLPEKHIESVLKMAEHLRKIEDTYECFNDNHYHELSFFWKDERSELLCKCRPDYISFDNCAIIDWKTTKAANADEFETEMGNYGYFISAAFYIEGVERVITDRFNFTFACATVMNTDPFTSMLLPIGETSIEAGRIAFMNGLNIIVSKQPAQSRVIEIPQYILRRYLND